MDDFARLVMYVVLTTILMVGVYLAARWGVEDARKRGKHE